MKTQNLQNITESNKLWQGSEISPQIVSIVSRSVRVTCCKGALWRPLCLQFWCWKESKGTSTSHLRICKQAHKIKPASRSWWLHWETVSDSGGFCKHPGAETQHVLHVTLAGFFFGVFSPSCSSNESRFVGHTSRKCVCTQQLTSRVSLGGCVVLVVSGWSLKTEAFILIILECANWYLPQAVNFYCEIVTLHWNTVDSVSPASYPYHVLPPQLCLSKCSLQ